MGRKIPGKKHRGVKDPNKQRARRLSELKTKINDPPKNIDDQDIPKSLQRVIKLKNDVKNNIRVQKKKKKKKGTKLIAVGSEYNKKLSHFKIKSEKVVPVFNQKSNESDFRFWNRVNRETHAFINETEFETKFNVEIKRNQETGEIEGIEKKPKDKLTELEKLKLKHKNINKKKKTDQDNKKLTKSQKRKQKLLEKRQNKNQDLDDFNSFKDKIEFGDIVHGPPELNVLPRKVNKTSDKVKSRNLLLNSILEEDKCSERENIKILHKTGKRKNLPVGERRQIEKQQKDVIAAYKLLKARKFGKSTISA